MKGQVSLNTEVTNLLQRGMAAAKAGRKPEARELLLRATELDERNEQAWLWLSGVVDSPEDQRVCLENVLAINPANTHAQEGLRWLEREESALSSTDSAAEDAAPPEPTILPSPSRRDRRVASPVPRAFRPRRRPGCVTFYAILLFLSSMLMILGALCLGWLVTSDEFAQAFSRLSNDPQFVTLREQIGIIWQAIQSWSVIVMGVLFAIAILYFAIAAGLWCLKRWARIAIIALNGLGILSSVASLVGSLLQPSGPGSVAASIICTPVLSIGISAYVIYWFWTNGDYFD